MSNTEGTASPELFLEVIVLSLKVADKCHVITKVGFRRQDVSDSRCLDVFSSAGIYQTVVGLLPTARERGDVDDHSCPTVPA
jgi:hypothetical protein